MNKFKKKKNIKLLYWVNYPIISNIKSFENYTNNKNKITNILDAFDYEQCLTTNSKHNINTSRNIINKDNNVDKMKEIF